MLPAQRGCMAEQLIANKAALLTKVISGTVEINGIP